MITAIFLIIGLSLLVMIHELGHFIAAKQAGIKVEEFGFGFPPRLKGWKYGETIYSINWLPFGGFVRIYGESKEKLRMLQEEGEVIDEKRSFAHQSLWRRFVVIAAGISINFIAGWLIISSVLMIGAHEAVVLTQIQPGSPAEAAGLLANDELVNFKDASAFVEFTHASQGKKVSIEVLRGEEKMNVDVTLRKVVSDTEGPLGAVVSKVGFARLGFFTALWQGLTTSVEGIAEIFKAFGSLIAQLFGHANLPSNIVGPVGIFGVAGDLGKLGFIYLMQLLAMISLNLAALNAIPFPALDGGRILFLVIEKITGRPIQPKRELWANTISFGFLLILMLVITGRDIVRLF